MKNLFIKGQVPSALSLIRWTAPTPRKSVNVCFGSLHFLWKQKKNLPLLIQVGVFLTFIILAFWLNTMKYSYYAEVKRAQMLKFFWKAPVWSQDVVGTTVRGSAAAVVFSNPCTGSLVRMSSEERELQFLDVSCNSSRSSNGLLGIHLYYNKFIV